MERLPNELLLCIGQHTQESRYPQKTLHALSLCCRRFHDVFQPLIYSYISSDSFSIAFVRFIIRLWRNPELASQVRRLYLCWSQCDQEPPEGVGEDVEILDFVEYALNEIFTPEEEESKSLWEEHLTGEGLCAEAWLGLMLVRLTHLQVIEFGHEHSELISDILRKAALREKPFHQASPFPYLREVRGCVAWGASWISSDFLMPFFYLPAVRSIYGSAIGETRDEQCPPPDTYRSSRAVRSSCPVREITVDEGYWCRGMLDWLAACTQLEHIDIRVEIQADEYEIEDEEKFDASQFRLALLPFTTTLRTLRIRYGDSYKDQMEETEADDAAFGSFKEFTALEHLTLPHAHLSGFPSPQNRRPLADILPLSLKTLEITDLIDADYLDLLSELSNLMGHRGSFGEFEQLVLHMQEEDEDLVNGLRLECEAASVDFKFRAEDYL